MQGTNVQCTVNTAGNQCAVNAAWNQYTNCRGHNDLFLRESSNTKSAHFIQMREILCYESEGNTNIIANLFAERDVAKQTNLPPICYHMKLSA